MPKLSVVIPSRAERFLFPTIEDIFRNRRGNTEVVAVLDQDTWPEGWADLVKKHTPDLHTVHMGSPKGMRAAINAGFGSAMSRGAEYVMKLDGHCSLSEGFDVVLLSEIEPDWIVIPRRGRLDPENWCATETHKPDIDYHYLSFPDDPQDFGGPGLNGKVWAQRAIERKDILVDEEMSSQGSAWLSSVEYFQQLELMDQDSYGPFWSEMQEIGLKCWLSGGKLIVNKKATYLHLHKGRKYGRGYRLDESALVTGRNQTMKWIWNEAWSKQTLPFEWLIDHFWPVPSWPENWREILYKERKPRHVSRPLTASDLKQGDPVVDPATTGSAKADDYTPPSGLQIHSAWYGPTVLNESEKPVNVADRLRDLAVSGSLDIRVDNSTLTPGQNPFRGRKKSLRLTYSFDGHNHSSIEREEKEILIIGKGQRETLAQAEFGEISINEAVKTERVQREQRIKELAAKIQIIGDEAEKLSQPPRTAAALNDYLIRKFSVSSYRLRAPMPIELSNFHRNDLAKLFGELGFTRGAEVGVAEGHFSEILCQSIPSLEKLYCVDPWHRYSENPQGHSKQHHEYALRETTRRLTPYMDRVELMQEYSMDAVRKIKPNSLDFVSIDAHHGFEFVMCDIIEWSKRVRSGGVVLLDDYYEINRARWGSGPVEAVQAYINAMRISPWFICAGTKSVEAWWVKP